MSFTFPDPPWPVVPGVDYGHDLSCFLRTVTLQNPDGSTFTGTIFDLAPDLGEVDGRLGFAEACARRLVTTAGTLVDDVDYGRDITEYVNDDIDGRSLAKIASDAAAEVLKDERAVHAEAKASFLDRVLTVSVSVFDAKGPFKLTLTADETNAAVLLTGVNP